MRRKTNAPEALDISTSTITPADAEAFLNNNTNNYRGLREQVYERYAEDMRAGNWELTGAPIVFNGDGTLIDGQHRLHACILAGVPFTTVIVRNAPEGALLATDTGLKRTIGDTLRRAGYMDGNNLAALLRLAYKFDNGTVLTAEAPTVHQQMAYLEAHPDLEEWVPVSGRLYKALGMRRTAGGLALYLTGRIGADATQDALAFVDQCVDGTHLEANSPVLALRKWSQRTARAIHQPNTVYQAAITLKALNAWRQGISVGLLSWKRGGMTNEPFPVAWEE